MHIHVLRIYGKARLVRWIVIISGCSIAETKARVIEYSFMHKAKSVERSIEEDIYKTEIDCPSRK